MDFRVAKMTDLDALNRLEKELFTGDRIAPRQMKRFIQSEHAVLLVADSGQQLAGYALLLFHQGTQLSRLYSIAVRPDFRGQKIAQSLIELCERSAIEQGFTTLRLEVREDNTAAINLYQKLGYKTFKLLIHYYDDLCDGIRMQKRLAHYGPKTLLPMPLYVQTTPFTCGAACLLMAFAHHTPEFTPSRKEELQLWREATTIFMAAGHGGCSGHGLALAAARRGYHVELWSHSKSTPFIDSVRDENKKQVIEIVHQDFCQQLQEFDVSMIEAPPTQMQLEQWVSEGASVLLLISTYRFNGSKEPHWVLLSGMSEHFFFIHDPHAESEQDAIASAHVTVSKKALSQIIGFGKQKHTACVVIKPGREPR
ncbi:GNAT family N-acetyltransferase/peptidase C39 family protein [Vibrio navarrensis]|uniref:GNAT family N-acetyltransferase/peptidase C39 family protein n=1 Tax=Vibrio navarrensis TaxID=29495 RepID=UPI0015586D86|nr:GNAT family N-acetyltransferase/peptidase C39 family protein [Vibrio navarrensis]